MLNPANKERRLSQSTLLRGREAPPPKNDLSNPLAPVCLDLRLDGDYVNVSVSFSEYLMKNEYQGGQVYERVFQWVTRKLSGCKVKVKGKTAYIESADGLKFRKKTTNKTLRIFYGRHPDFPGHPTTPFRAKKTDHEGI